MYLSLNSPRFMLVLCAVMLVGSCKSTRLNDNLGTRVSAQGTQVVFEWAENHPFAADFARQPVQLVAEYTELGADGRTRPVRQVLSQADNRLAELRQKVFSLPQQLLSVPDNSNICLYLQMQRSPVPVRAAGRSDTARFAYPQWQQLVAGTTRQNILQRELGLAQQNLAIASQNVKNAQQQHMAQLKDYNQQLAAEPLHSPVVVADAAGCSMISVQPASLQTPWDVVAPDQIPQTAAQICMHRAFNSYGHFSHPVLSLLPWALDPEHLGRVQNALEQQQLAFFNNVFIVLARSYSRKYKDTPYRPELGAAEEIIEVNKNAFVSRNKIWDTINSQTTLTAEQATLLRSVFAHEIQEFKSCISEGETQLQTKYSAWQQRKAAIPQRALARTQFLAEKCQLLFSSNNSKIQALTQQQNQAETLVATLQNQLAQADSRGALAEKPLLLNPLSCAL